MSRWCALCGAEYVDGVAECADCLVPVVHDRPLSGDQIADAEGEQLAYEFADIDAQGRHRIDRALAAAGVAHAWEDDGTTVLVSPDDEPAADAILGDLGALAPAGAADLDALGDEDEQLVYDLSDWDGERRAELVGRLATEGIAHVFDEDGDLVVRDVDEERVDVLIDAVEFPDQLDADESGPEAGGLDAIEALSELFVAADRLVHDPAESESVVAVFEVSRRAEAMPVPYGFAPAVWQELLDRAGSLRSLLESDNAVLDDDVVEAATRLRSALRPYV